MKKCEQMSIEHFSKKYAGAKLAMVGAGGMVL